MANAAGSTPTDQLNAAQLLLDEKAADRHKLQVER